MINTKRLRGMLGWLGMLLPLIVLALCLIFGYGLPDSISATYYLGPTVTPFMIILGSSGILLISYKGYDKQDDIVCSLAGVFGLGICLFPCKVNELMHHWEYVYFPEKVGTFQLDPEISGWIHIAFALSFFGLLAYNSIFLFTKGSENPTEQKKKRNIIFRVCGIGMIVSFLGIIPVLIFSWWGGTWVVETVALAFFGISWLTKSGIYSWLFRDPVD